MTLRSILVGLVGLNGLVLLATAGLFGYGAARHHASLQTQVAAQHDMNALSRLVTALGREEVARIEAAQSASAAAHLVTARARTDAALAATLSRLATPDPATEPQADTRLLADLLSTLMHQRQHGPHSSPALSPQPRAPEPRAPYLRALEQSLLRNLDARAPADPALHAVAILRGIILRDLLVLVQNRSRIEARLAAFARVTPQVTPQVTLPRDPSPAAAAFARFQSGATAARTAQSEAAADHSALLPHSIADTLRLALGRVEHLYQPAEARLLAAFNAQGVDATTLAIWRNASRLSIANLLKADTLLANEAIRHFDGALALNRTRLIATAAAFLSAAGLVIAVQRILSRRILTPLDDLRTRIAQVAAEDFSPCTPSGKPLPDISAMHRALDQLALDGRRRLAMQAELARLGDRVVTANRQMTADLEAAARVQRAQLPAAPCAFPGGTFHAFFRPSRVVAGDTYDCLTLPDGRSRIFQIDVSGHGAPAALVSIASHIALKQALLSAPPCESLADIIARINRDWAEDLPYFTLLAVEIDPATETASIVQCGHPALIRLPAKGGIEALGNGGLPIGVLPDADFATLTCPFRSGDRLVLVTDGVTETADPDGRMFGDDRLRALLATTPQSAPRNAAHPHNAPQTAPHGDLAHPILLPSSTRHQIAVPGLFDRIEQALWDWRGSEILEDDITILVLEAI